MVPTTTTAASDNVGGGRRQAEGQRDDDDDDRIMPTSSKNVTHGLCPNAAAMCSGVSPLALRANNDDDDDDNTDNDEVMVVVDGGGGGTAGGGEGGRFLHSADRMPDRPGRQPLAAARWEARLPLEGSAVERTEDDREAARWYWEADTCGLLPSTSDMNNVIGRGEEKWDAYWDTSIG